MGRKRNDLTGKEFGYWLVKEYVGVSKHRHSNYLCLCRNCNTEKVVTGNTLTKGESTKCNDCRLEGTTYNMAYSRKIKRIVDEMCIAIKFEEKENYKKALKKLLNVWERHCEKNI